MASEVLDGVRDARYSKEGMLPIFGIISGLAKFLGKNWGPAVAGAGAGAVWALGACMARVCRAGAVWGV